MPEIYGIKNCDRCRAARRWLSEHGLRVSFVDLKAQPPSDADIDRWIREIGWQRLLNRMSRTWRELPEEKKKDLDAPSAARLLLAHPLLLKRPVLVRGSQLHVGFTPEHYQEIFGVSAE